jgi:hypothetical protein
VDLGPHDRRTAHGGGFHSFLDALTFPGRRQAFRRSLPAPAIRSYGAAVHTSRALAALHRMLEGLRAEYVASGRGEEFDDHVLRLRAEGTWPFDSRD